MEFSVAARRRERARRRTGKCCVCTGVSIVIVIIVGMILDANEPDTVDCASLPNTLTHNGVQRCWLQYVPPSSANRPRPLLLDLHGYTATAGAQRAHDGWAQLAESEKLIVAWPNGLHRSWNAGGLCCGIAARHGVDDVGFLRALVARLRALHNVDSERIYVTGHSNGCMMAQRFAREASETVAAVGCMSGYLHAHAPAASAPRLRMPALEVHCANDRQVKYDPGAHENLERWAAWNGCAGQAEVVWRNASSTLEAHTACDGGSEARLLTLRGCGHWPYQPTRRHEPSDARLAEDAVRIAWDFMRRFRRRAPQDAGSARRRRTASAR